MRTKTPNNLKMGEFKHT